MTGDRDLIISGMAAAFRTELRKVARRFVGTGDWEGCRDAVRRRLEELLAVYHGFGLGLNVSRVETTVVERGGVHGVSVTFIGPDGKKVKDPW